MKRVITLTVNGNPYELLVPVNQTLAQVLRGPQLNLTGTKQGCETGDCGACTVILNGEAVNSCLVLAVQADGAEVRTIEGLAQAGELHPIQTAFVEEGAIQCGYCSPGMMMSTQALLDREPEPDRQQIRKSIAGNLCRCTGYYKIVNAVERASRDLAEQKE